MVGECDEGGVHAFGIAACKERVLVIRVLVEPLVTHGDDLVGEAVDLVMRLPGDVDFALVEEEAVVCVVGGVEQVLLVELAKDGDDEDVVPGHRVLRMLLRDLVEVLKGGVKVQIVEADEALVDEGVEVQGVGVGCGLGFRSAAKQ